MEIRYNTWKRKNWVDFYKYLKDNYSNSEANTLLWEYWTNENNPYKDQFNVIESLLFNLITYRDKASVNSLQITANSVPVYNTWSNWWNDSASVWDCHHWIEWYEKNALAYGANSTKYKFADAWRNQDNFSVGLFGDGMGWTCGRDCDFINYFRVKGIDVTVFGASTVCNLVAIPSNLLDATANLTQTVSSSTKVLSNILPPLIGLGAILFFYNMSKKK